MAECSLWLVMTLGCLYNRYTEVRVSIQARELGMHYDDFAGWIYPTVFHLQALSLTGTPSWLAVPSFVK